MFPFKHSLSEHMPTLFNILMWTERQFILFSASSVKYLQVFLCCSRYNTQINLLVIMSEHCKEWRALSSEMLRSVVWSAFNNILEECATSNFKITACCLLGLIFDLEDGYSKLHSHCSKNLKTHAVERMFEQTVEKQKTVRELKHSCNGMAPSGWWLDYRLDT